MLPARCLAALLACLALSPALSAATSPARTLSDERVLAGTATVDDSTPLAPNDERVLAGSGRSLNTQTAWSNDPGCTGPTAFDSGTGFCYAYSCAPRFGTGRIISTGACPCMNSNDCFYAWRGTGATTAATQHVCSGADQLANSFGTCVQGPSTPAIIYTGPSVDQNPNAGCAAQNPCSSGGRCYRAKCPAKSQCGSDFCSCASDSECVGSFLASLYTPQCISGQCRARRTNLALTSCSLCTASSDGYWCPSDSTCYLGFAKTLCSGGFISSALSCSATSCSAGQYLSSGTCFLCPANTYNMNGGSINGSCTACPFGYSSGVGSTSPASCVLCPSGQYYSSAQSACASCPSGQTSPSGSTSSAACVAAAVVTYPQYSACVPCASFSDGYWCPQTSTCYAGGSTAACSGGTISSSSACPTSASCSAGQYLSFGSCANCPLATFSTGGSSSSCTPCPAGLSAPVGSTSPAACIVAYACPAGKYNAFASSSSSGCAPCDLNTYSAAGQLSCSRCYPGQTAPPGSAACVKTGSGAALPASSCAALRSLADLAAVALPAPGAGSLRCPIWSVQGSGASARVVTNGTEAVPGGLCISVTGLCSKLFDEGNCVGYCTDSMGKPFFGCPPNAPRQSRIVSPDFLRDSLLSNLALLGSASLSGFNITMHLCSNATCGDCSSFSCPAGTHNPTLGQTSKSCVQCSVGRYSPAGAAVCCPLGTYQLLGSTECLPCAAGTANSVQGSASPSDCQACAPGLSSGAGAGTCCALGSWAPPGASTCTLCPAGSFSTTLAATSAESCQLCLAGTYHPRAGASTPCGLCSPGTYAPAAGASTCTACPTGTFQPTSGASSVAACFPCNPGYYANASGSEKCSACPPGTASSDTQAASASVCVPCEPGSYSTLEGQQLCGKYCPKGYVGSTSGGASLAQACSACKPGSYSSFSGGTECEECAPGRYASQPNSSRCTLCAPGTASPFLGAASESTCSACAPGSYALAAGSTACISCPPGRACAAGGASDPSQCAACLPGRYAPLPGSSVCALAPPGTYAAAGATVATPCALGRYGTQTGASTADQCAPCPAGLYTASEGATQATQCLAIAVSCGAGTQLAAVGAAGSASSSPLCVPLTCAPPLRPEAYAWAPEAQRSSSSVEKDALLLNQSSTCVGCGVGSSGVPPDCLPCPLGSACPGLLSLPLANFSRQLPRAGTAADLPWKDCPALAQAPAQGPLPAPSPPLSRSLVGLYSGGSLLGALLLVAVALGRCSDSVLRCLARFTASVDIYALSHHVPPNASPVSVTTSLGGVFTLMAYTAICTYAAFMVVQFLDNNTLEQRSLGSLTEGVWGSVAALPWAAIGEPGAGGGSANLQLRVTAAGEPGACAAPAFAFSGLEAGAWSLETLRDCGGAAAASQLRLSCAACRLTPDTRLTLDFHYSCQALFLEASGVPPYPRSPLARTLLTAPPALTAGQAAEGGGALLGEVTWEVTPVLSVLFDNSSTALSLALGREGFSGSLGWQLTGQRVALGAALGAARGANGSLALAPAAARVRLTIALPLASTYALTVLSPQVQVSQLLANIVGLSGMLGLFGVLFQAYERYLAGRGKAGRVLAPGPESGSVEQKAAGAAEGVSQGAAAQESVLTENPLTQQHQHQHQHQQLQEDNAVIPLQAVALPQESVTWTRHREGRETWYVSSKGESAWVLPEGAVASRRSSRREKE